MYSFKNFKKILNSIILLMAIFFVVSNFKSYANDFVELKQPRDVFQIMVLKDDMPYAQAPFILSKFEQGQSFANTVLNFKTDERGFYILNSFEANTKYELRAQELRTIAYINDKIVFETNSEGKIYKIYSTNEELLQDVVIFMAMDNSGNLETQEVNVKIVDKEGNAVSNVPFTANNITLLSSYQTKESNEEGIVTFELEARGTYTGNLKTDMMNAKSYSITLSKKGQFMWDFVPEEITIHVFQNDVVVSNGKELKFEVTKNDRTHLLDDLKNLIQKAKDYIAKNEFTTETAPNRLNEVIRIAEEELLKETVPGYAEAFISSLDTEMEKLKKYEVLKKVDETKPKEESKQQTTEISSTSSWSVVRPEIISKSNIDSKESTKNIVAIIELNKNVYKVKENDKFVEKTAEVYPIINKGRVMLSARLIADIFGIDVKFDNETKTAKFTVTDENKQQNNILLTLGKKTMIINDKEVNLSSDILNVNGRILLPVRDIQKSIKELGIKTNIKWNNEMKSLSLEK